MLKKKLAYSFRFAPIAKVFLCILTLTLIPPIASAYDSPAVKSYAFDPKKCSEDPHGMTYFSIGKIVMRYPTKETFPTLTSAVIPSTNIPPKPSDPEGCPGNPIQSTVTFKLQFNNLPVFENKDEIVSMHLVNNDIYENKASLFNYEQDFDHCIKDQSHVSNDSIANLKSCHMEKPGLVINMYQSEKYLTPTERKFTVYCNNVGHFFRNPGCEITYGLSDGIRIRYSFSQNALPASDFIALDKYLRKHIEAAEVKDYSWGNQSNTKN